MNLHGKVWTRWRTIPPPKLTEVWGLYEGDDEKPQRGKSCKGGCCWQPGYGLCVPPTWWAPIEEQRDNGTAKP